MPTSPRLYIRVKPVVKHYLERLAEQQHTTLSDVSRDILEKHLLTDEYETMRRDLVILKAEYEKLQALMLNHGERG